MSKPKLNVLNVGQKEPTRSILNLLSAYHGSGKGLEAKHFRYALMDEYSSKERIIRDLQVEANVKKLREFFGDNKLQMLYFHNKVKRGCINSSSTLNYSLRKLVELGVIIKINKIEKISRYILSEDYYKGIIRGENLTILNTYDQDLIMTLDEKESNKSENSHHVLYGISCKLFDSLPKVKKDEINTHIKEIEGHIKQIYDIKIEGIKKFYARKNKRIFKNIKNQKLKNIKTGKHMNFLSLIHTINEYEEFKRLDSRALPFSNLWDIWEKHMGFSHDEIKEIIKRGKRELKDILHDYEKKQISYSAYNDEVQWFRNIGLDTVLSDLFDAFDIIKGENYNDLYMELAGIEKKRYLNRLES